MQKADRVHALTEATTFAQKHWHRLVTARAETEAAAFALASSARFTMRDGEDERAVALLRKRRRQQFEAMLAWSQADAEIEVALEALAPQPVPTTE